jgi:hypothetical protein
MIRLAFTIHFNRTWLGGINVIVSLINSILSIQNLNSKIKIIVLTNSKKKLSKLKISKKVEVIESFEFFSRSLFVRILDKVSIIFFNKTIFLEKFLKRYNIDFLSHTSIATGKNSDIKSIVWIPDFQYLHFPNFFSLKYKILKKINILIYKNHAYKILLSSKSAFKDLHKITNIHNSKILINKFSFDVPNSKNLRSFSYLKKKYKLRKNYFYLPNQYWVHKNHKVVLEALVKTIKHGKKDVFIYSSGSKEDYRDPQNFQNLFKYVKNNNIEKNYIYLGLIPFIDVMSLIFYSTAVINPSLFEGWSSTVEQAKMYNKKIVLSNINVHREQNPKYAFFFNSHDSNKLSNIFQSINSIQNKKKKPIYKLSRIRKKNDNYIKNYINLILKVR